LENNQREAFSSFMKNKASILMEVGQKAFDYNKLLFQNGDDIAGATFGLDTFRLQIYICRYPMASGY